MSLRSALAVVGAYGFFACSFPEYDTDPPEPAVDPLASVCTDGQPSPAESGIDCGGGCPPCGMGEKCNEHDDCESLACANGTCQQPSCDDKVKNGAEADIDCGGVCAPCPFGKVCTQPADCADGVCTGDICQVPSCNDGVRNGSETGMDCGGSCDVSCPIGSPCTENADCETMHCSELVCVSPDCTDGMQNNAETDVDCGGSECGPCQPNKHCAVGTDCTSLICDDAKLCTAYSCDDGVLNGKETEPDCGGGACQGCGELQDCMEGRDCASGACQSNLCVPAAPTGVVLSRAGFDADSSHTYPDDDPDEVLDSVGGRWTSGADQFDGMWFEVDMGEVKTFFKVILTCTEQPQDAPVKFDFYLSVDDDYGAPTRAGLFGKPTTEVTFDTAQVARYIKIVLRAPSTNWLSINEINVVQ
jgi:hypothetical protein